MEKITTYGEVIALFGKRGELAKAIGEPPGLVRIWRKRGAIPPRAFEHVAKAAKVIGHPEITVKFLTSLKPQEIPNGTKSLSSEEAIG